MESGVQLLLAATTPETAPGTIPKPAPFRGDLLEGLCAMGELGGVGSGTSPHKVLSCHISLRVPARRIVAAHNGPRHRSWGVLHLWHLPESHWITKETPGSVSR